jgi:hypothetical protein
MHTDCALCEVRTAFLCIVDMKFRLRYQVSLCEIFGGKIGVGTGFSFSTSDFPCHCRSFKVSNPYSPCYYFQKDKRTTPGNFQKTSLLRRRVKQLYHDSNHSLCTASRLRNRVYPLPLPNTSLNMVRDVSEPEKLHDSSSVPNAARHPLD